MLTIKKGIQDKFIHSILNTSYNWKKTFDCVFQFYKSSDFNLINLDKMDEEEIILNLMRYLIIDILATEEYTLEGIATYARVPLDVIIDIVSGLNNNPSLSISLKIIQLHSIVRRSVYENFSHRVD